MLKKIDFKYLVGAAVALSISYLTMAGIIQNYIHFSGIDNEMGFAFILLLLGIMLMFGIKK